MSRPRGFGLEAPQDLAAVQTEVIAIGAHEADRVSRPGKTVRTPLLERRQIGGLDPESVRYVTEIEAERLALLPQQITCAIAALPAAGLRCRFRCLQEGA